MQSFLNGRIVLYEGDCIDIMPMLATASVDLILADLPYGTTQNKWDSIIPLDRLWSEYWRICNGAVVLTAQTPFDKELGVSCLENLRYEWIWEKANGTGFLNAKIAPLKTHENVLVFYRSLPTYNPQMTAGKAYGYFHSKGSTNYNVTSGWHTENNGTRYPRSVLKFPHCREKLHPTQKPVTLMEYMIRTYTNPSAVVLDNCMGSGTTGVAAIRSGRRFIGIERDPGYFEIATRRIEEALKAIDEQLPLPEICPVREDRRSPTDGLDDPVSQRSDAPSLLWG